MMTGLFATLSKYRVVSRLGSGGMAEVYLVLSERPGGFNKLQVLKLMRSDLSDQERPEFLQMFQDEARLAARLNHPNIVQSFEVGAEDGQPYIVMEFLEGQPLHRVQQRRNVGAGFSMDMELLVLCQVLEGLEYAHHVTDYEGKLLHMVHRDVSPQNVFVTYSGQSKLVDFGVAKTLESSKTRAGVVKGKVAYMPPEQVKTGPIDHRADLFSVGVLLWEAVARQPMHADLSVYESLSRLVRGDLPKLRDVVPSVDPALERIVQRALEIDPNLRYQDAESFRAELLAYLDSISKVRPRDVGNAVSQLFAQERAELSQIIRRSMTSTPPRADEPDARESAVNGRPITRRLPADEGKPDSKPTQQPAGTAVAAAADSQGQSSSAERARKRRLSALSAVLALGALGIVVLLTLRSHSSDNTAVSAPTSALPPSTPQPPRAAAAPAQAEIQISIAVEPKSASIVLDGRPLSPNPYRSQEPRDAQEHTLSVSAPGYVPQRRMLGFNADLTIALQLEKRIDEPSLVRQEARAPNTRAARVTKTEDTKPSTKLDLKPVTKPANPEPYEEFPAPRRIKRSAPELDKGDPWLTEPAH